MHAHDSSLYDSLLSSNSIQRKCSSLSHNVNGRTSHNVNGRTVNLMQGSGIVINCPLRKLAHAMNRYFLALKIENFQLKNFDIFLIFAQNIDCGYTLEPPHRGGSNEYPQSMFWSKNKKNRYTPAYPSFSI